jgi:hypothetical protein
MTKRWLSAAGLSLGAIMVSVGTFAGAGAASASPTSPLRPLCAPVYATGSGQDLGNFHTAAKIFVGPVLVATTAASFTPTGISGTSVSFAGPIGFTSVGNLGTFTVSAAGSVDTSTGHFEVNGPVNGPGTVPTGLFVGASGQLTIVGNENLTTGAFTETVTGQVCIGNPLAPQ